MLIIFLFPITLVGSIPPLHGPAVPQVPASRSDLRKTPPMAMGKQGEGQQGDSLRLAHGVFAAGVDVMSLPLTKPRLAKASLPEQRLQETCKAPLQPQDTAPK